MTEQGRWPSATDYIDAVQHPSVVFADGELKEASFDLDMYGIPDGCTGSNAIVFRAMLGRRTVALRCFTSQAGLSRERYLALARHVQADERGARWLVPAGWRDDALRVKGDQWPLIEMEWVNGRPLDVYVGSLCQTQPSALRLLADRWLEMLLDLAAAQVAHGDLQHGNVLVDQSSTALRLVDLDGAWVPGMQGLAAPAESGHQAFRHPNRPSTDQWGAYMDTFPGLVVLVSLLALASRPDLWATYNNGDNLIFTADDFTAVDATSLWRDLAKIDDRDVADLVLLLKQCCDPTWLPDTTLADLIATAPVASGAPPEPATETPAQPTLAEEATTTAAAAIEAVPAPAAPEPLGDDLDWDVHVPVDAGPPARTVADPAIAVAGARGSASSDTMAGVIAGAPPPTSTSALPPPPAVEAATMHAPVENSVLDAPLPDATNPDNPFTLPAMARGAAGPGAAPSATRASPGVRTPSARTEMARGYLVWTVLALVVGLIVFGVPALLISRTAHAEQTAGETEKAIKHSQTARTVAVLTVIIMLTVYLVAIIQNQQG